MYFTISLIIYIYITWNKQLFPDTQTTEPLLLHIALLYELSLHTYSDILFISLTSHTYTAPSEPAETRISSFCVQYNEFIFPLCPLRIPKHLYVHVENN